MKDMGDTVILTKREYQSMQKRLDKLDRLEAYGVDNWSGYSDAMCDELGVFEDEE
jgi:hypothetical protein